jgi:hypothetical protein
VRRPTSGTAQKPDERSAVRQPGRSRLREGLEELIAISAFLVSLASIAIAYQENRATKQLVQASTLPYLTFSSTFTRAASADASGALTTGITRVLENNGVGPADVRYAIMTFNGRKYGDVTALLRDCCGVTHPHTTATLTNRMIRPGVGVTFLDVQGTAAERAGIEHYAQLLQSSKIDTMICYCSVFNDCWTVSDDNQRPVAAPSCPIIPSGRGVL